MIRLFAIFLILSPWALLAQNDLNSDYTITQWEMKDGLPSENIRTLQQDSKGYIWIATFQGLVRFDGIRFVTYRLDNTPTLPNNLIQSLLADSQDRIWLGHDTGNLSVLQEGAVTTIPVPDEWKGIPIDRIVESGDGTIVVRNRKGQLLPIRSFQAGGIIQLPHNETASFLSCDKSGNIWVGTEEEIFKLDITDTSISKGRSHKYKKAENAMIFPDPNEGMWIATGNTLEKLDTESMTITRRFPQNVRKRSWTPHWMMRNNGEIVAATFTSGLVLIRKDGSSITLDKDAGLPTNWIRAILEDREGSLWLATGDRGLISLRLRTIDTMTPPDHWNDRPLHAIFEDSTGSFWMGTEGSGLYRFHEDTWTKINLGELSDTAVIKSIIEPISGELWINANLNVYKYHTSDSRLEIISEGIGHLSVMFNDSKGRIWAGGLDNLYQWKTNHWSEIKAGDRSIGFATKIVETTDGDIWVGCLGTGLVRINPSGEITEFPNGMNGPSSNFITSLEAGKQGNLWIGTHDSGLNIYRDGAFYSISTHEGIPHACISQIIEDENYLWLGTNQGIARIGIEEIDDLLTGRSSRVNPLIVDTINDLGTAQLAINTQNTSLKCSDGRLFFATRRGLAIVDPEKITGHPDPPKVILEEARIDGNAALFDNATSDPPILKIPAGARRIEIDYTALNLTNARNLTFQYTLSGDSNEWIQIGKRRTLFFSNLKPGKHRLQIQVSSSPEQSSTEPTQLALIVEPFFWQTKGFILLVVIVALLITSTIVFVWTRFRYQRRMQRMKRKQAIKDERTRIAHDLHDDIGSGLNQLSYLTDCIESALEDPLAANAVIHDIHDTTEEMTDSIDQIVWAVNPNYDSLESLLVYISHIAQSHAKRAGVACRLRFPPEPQNVIINPEARYEICLALREALHNTLKHAKATEIKLEFSHEANEMILSLEDNGIGFKPGEAQPSSHSNALEGLGLTSMKKRMQKIGGQFDCKSTPGQGVKITFRFNPESSKT